jgi:predicted transcriptional regulator
MTHSYRNTTDIVAKILESAAEEEGKDVTKTQLMYKAFLSYEQLKHYLPILIESGLLEYSNGNNQFYKVTDKGMKFVSKYEEIAEYMSIMPKEENHW